MNTTDTTYTVPEDLRTQLIRNAPCHSCQAAPGSGCKLAGFANGYTHKARAYAARRLWYVLEDTAEDANKGCQVQDAPAYLARLGVNAINEAALSLLEGELDRIHQHA